MADWTPQQLQQMNAVVMGTHDKLTPGGQIQPGYTLDQIYSGILPASKPPAVANTLRSPTPAQLAAMKNVPPGSYQRPPAIPIYNPTIPSGSAYTDTGNYGRASGSMLQQLMLAGTPSAGRPAWTIPMTPQVRQAANVPLPRRRPGNAPTILDMAAINAPPAAPVGANPGMGGAMIGDGVMAPGIAPQGPPPPGIAPTVWAGDQPQQAGGPLNITVRGGQGPTGTAGGYQYVNGRKVGYAPQTIGGRTYTPTNGATAYGLANAAGQIAALNRQATATGKTGVYNYVNGVKTGTVNGQSSANAYAAANAKPGSVAEWERKASGNQSSSGGPSGGYASGGR